MVNFDYCKPKKTNSLNMLKLLKKVNGPKTGWQIFTQY